MVPVKIAIIRKSKPQMELKKYASYFFILGVAITLASLPLSKFTMSIGQMMMGFGWLLQRNYKERLSLLKNEPAAWALIGVFFLHLLWLWNTSDFSYAFKDLRTKLPLFIIPFMMSTWPTISKKEKNFIIGLFLAATFSATLFTIKIAIVDNPINYRDLSPFISHIRFSLCILAAIFLSLYSALQQPNVKYRLLLMTLALWFVIMLFVLQSMTGVSIFLIIVYILTIRTILKSNQFKPYLKIILLLFLLGLPSTFIAWSSIQINKYITPQIVDFNKVQTEKTVNGNLYLHDTISYGVENGRYVGLFINYPELDKAWSRRSQMSLSGKDKSNQNITPTLIRYLASKNLRKDSAAVMSLSNNEIKYIENGIADVNLTTRNPYKAQLWQFMFGYAKYLRSKDPRESSLMQRIELWKCSVELIRKHFWTGVGTGDIPKAYSDMLKEMKSPLSDSHLRAHNQYLSIFVAFGILGFSLFLFFLIIPIIYYKRYGSLVNYAFVAMILLSMLNEDTIENQAGVTFVALIWSYILIINTKADAACIKSNNP